MALPDVVAAVRKWAIGDAEISAIFADRVATSLPDPERRVYPFLRMVDLGTLPSTDEAPRIRVSIQFDSFAGKTHDDRSSPDWPTASLGARTIADRIRAFDGVSPEFPGFSRRITVEPGEDVIIQGAEVGFGPVRQPDPEGLGRYRVDVIFTAKNG